MRIIFPAPGRWYTPKKYPQGVPPPPARRQNRLKSPYTLYIIRCKRQKTKFKKGMFPIYKVAKVVVFLPKLSLCRFTHFCPSTFPKMSLQFVPPPVPPLPKIDHFWHKKGEPESSPNTHKLPSKSIQGCNAVPTRPKHPKSGVLSPYSSSGDTLLIRPPEISVDCLITARFVITVPFPLSPACSR